jgi:hypothetical protein
MRSVRCDVCGTKALTAASQCPKCAHLFEVRDGFGTLLPLAYCSACDSYYPERVGSCRWCGTKPEPPPKGPRLWKGFGVAALAGLVIALWLMRDASPKQTADVRLQAKAPTVAPAQSEAPAAPVVSSDSGVSQKEIAAVDAVASPATIDTSLANVPASLTPPSRTSTRWVNSIAKDWVVVRARPDAKARLIASVGPNTRVQLGDTSGTWRQLKTRGMAGWVEARSPFVAAPMPIRRRGLVLR